MVLWTELSCHVILLLLCLLFTDARNLNGGTESRWVTRFVRREIKRAQDSPRAVVTPNSQENIPRTANSRIGLDLWRTKRQGALAMNNPYIYRNQMSRALPLKYWNYNTWANRQYMNPFYFNPKAQAFFKPYNTPNAALGNSILDHAVLRKNLRFFAKSRSNVDEDKKFVEDKIQEYYEERLNKNKNQWMYKLVNGTSRHIKKIFIGRCWDFILNKGQYLENPSALDCKALWKTFKKGFAYKDPCAVTDNDYTPFFEMYKEKPLRNRVMLWSGTRELTHAFSRLYGRYTTLEDTFAGFLLNGLRWCGTKKKPGINFTSCPYECSKQKPFFGHAAERLAMRARGVVHVMLNGTRQHFVDKQIFPTFMDYSYLGRNQLTSLPVPKITEFRILVGHSLHHKSLERCGSLTVLELQNRARERGLKTTCYDNPYFIRHLLCLENPGDPLCLFEIPDQEATL